MLAEVALLTLGLTVAVGLTLLAALLRARRRLGPLVLVHLVSALVALTAWAAYVAGGEPAWLAWAVLLLLVGTNTLGDMLMVRGWRAREARAGRPVPTGVRVYVGAARDVLSFSRPTAALHALLGAVGFFSVLLVTLGVGD